MRSLVLIGHGSHRSAQAAEGVHQCAEQLRVQGHFREVVEAYWLEEPSLRQVLKTVQFTDVTVVPLLLGASDLTEYTFALELGLGHRGPVPVQGVNRVISGRTVHYLRPYGLHPLMQEVILARVREALAEELLQDEALLQDTALVVLGDLSGASAAQQQARALQERGLFAQVLTLPWPGASQGPPWRQLRQDIAQQVSAARAVIVPFVDDADEWCTPESLAAYLEHEDTLGVQEPTLHYIQPLATHELVARVVLELAVQAHKPLGGDLDRNYQAAWQQVLDRAAAGPLRVGEVLVSPQAGLFDVRHTLDEGRSHESLRTLVTLSGLWERARHDDTGAFRPLPTLRTLPRGWRAVFAPADLPRALQYLYPAVIEESVAHQNHALRFTPWAATAQRQSRYQSASLVTPMQVEQAAKTLCTRCLKTRIWAGEVLSQTFLSGAPGAIPCAEACTLLLSQVSAEGDTLPVSATI